MFWNSNELKRILRRATYYPQIFSADISNCHGRLNNSRINKVNCYNTLVDKLQKGNDSTPIKFQNMAHQLSMLARLSEQKDKSKFEKICSDFENRLSQLKRNVSCLMESNVSTRAEFRIDVSRVNSLTSIICLEFDSESILDKSVFIDSDSLSNWCRINIEMLSAPIKSALAMIWLQLESGSYDSFESCLSTISAFESLLCSSLFTGRTYSYTPELIWKKSVNKDDSVELMNRIRKLNHIQIPSTFWNSNNDLLLNSLNFPNIIKRISNFERSDLRAHFDLVKVLSHGKGTKIEEAICIWKVYFNCLVDSNFSY